MEDEEELQRDAEGELVRLDYDLDTLKGERAIKVSAITEKKKKRQRSSLLFGGQNLFNSQLFCTRII